MPSLDGAVHACGRRGPTNACVTSTCCTTASSRIAKRRRERNRTRKHGLSALRRHRTCLRGATTHFGVVRPLEVEMTHEAFLHFSLRVGRARLECARASLRAEPVARTARRTADRSTRRREAGASGRTTGWSARGHEADAARRTTGRSARWRTTRRHEARHAARRTTRRTTGQASNGCAERSRQRGRTTG